MLCLQHWGTVVPAIAPVHCSITNTIYYIHLYLLIALLNHVSSQDRVAAGIKKLKEARKKGGQMRMDSFFKAKPVAEGSGSSASGAKRKPEPAKKGSAKGGAKGGGAKGKAPAAKKAKK
jgi:hypothetical protein